MNPLRVAGLVAVLTFLVPTGPKAAGLQVEVVPLPGRAETIASGPGGILVRLSDGRVFALDGRGSTAEMPVAMWPRESGDHKPEPVRDARIATGGGDIAEAWYAGETTRYRHGALGDAIEAESLAVQLADGPMASYRLGPDEVFEDLEPRIVDLDRDLVGRDEVVAIVSSLDRGAAVTVFAIGPDGEGRPALLQLARSRPIGTANRWLNIAGIADFDGDGFIEIAYVDRPHILGDLVFLEWRGGRLAEQARLGGYANHMNGSRVQDLSEVADVDGDGRPDVVVPVLGFGALAAVRLSVDGAREIARVPLAAPPASAILGLGRGAAFLDGDGIARRVSW